MNDENLVPNSERTPKERSDIARKGGIASGKARRQRKTLRETARAIVELQIGEGERADIDKASSINDFISSGAHTIEEAMILGQVAVLTSKESSRKEKAQATKLLMQMLGEDTVEVTVRKDVTTITYDEAMRWIARERDRQLDRRRLRRHARGARRPRGDGPCHEDELARLRP